MVGEEGAIVGVGLGPAICLYFVKRNGRNGVRSFEALAESGELRAGNENGDVELF